MATRIPPTICKALLQGATIVVLDKSTGQTLASFGVHDDRSVQYRIAVWEVRENCLVENYTDGMLGKYRSQVATV